jgi:hypothetical protein
MDYLNTNNTILVIVLKTIYIVNLPSYHVTEQYILFSCLSTEQRHAAREVFSRPMHVLQRIIQRFYVSKLRLSI